MEHTKSLGNQMSKPVKCIYYAATMFGNAIWNKVLGVAVTKDVPSYEVGGVPAKCVRKQTNDRRYKIGAPPLLH